MILFNASTLLGMHDGQRAGNRLIRSALVSLSPLPHFSSFVQHHDHIMNTCTIERLLFFLSSFVLGICGVDGLRDC
jgi:hypothetical protein